MAGLRRTSMRVAAVLRSQAAPAIARSRVRARTVTCRVNAAARGVRLVHGTPACVQRWDWCFMFSAAAAVCRSLQHAGVVWCVCEPRASRLLSVDRCPPLLSPSLHHGPSLFHTHAGDSVKGAASPVTRILEEVRAASGLRTAWCERATRVTRANLRAPTRYLRRRCVIDTRPCTEPGVPHPGHG